MPSYPLSLPTNVHPENVRVRRRTATAVAESPFTLQQQVYQHTGERWEIEVALPAMPFDEADEWTQFFYDLHGRAGYFSLNLTPHCPGLSPAPGTLNFRLAEDPQWDSKLAREFGFSFRAVQVL